MINVCGIASWSGAGVPRFVRLGGRHRLEIAVRSVERSIGFYRRVFGFRATIDSNAQSATIAVASNAELVLVAGEGSVEESSIQGRWGFLVTDLEAVREKVWDLGVRVACDSGAPDQIYREGSTRLLHVHDPDCNLIPLIEVVAERALHFSAIHRGIGGRRCPIPAAVQPDSRRAASIWPNSRI